MISRLFTITLLFAALFASAFAQAATTVTVGAAVKFTVTTVGGTNPATFQYTWFKNNVPITGAGGIGPTFAIYLIPKVALSDAGNYSVAVENAAGRTDAPAVAIATKIADIKVDSATISVVVQPPPAP